MNGMSYLCLNSFIFFFTAVRDTVLKEKSKIGFFDTSMILLLRYCS